MVDNLVSSLHAGYVVALSFDVGTFHALDLRSVMLNVDPSSWETISNPSSSSSIAISPVEEWNLMVNNFEKFVAHHTAPLNPPRDVADEDIASHVTIPEAFRVCWWFLRGAFGVVHIRLYSCFPLRSLEAVCRSSHGALYPSRDVAGSQG